MTTLPKSLLDNPLLGTWIGFEETGRVRLATGKVEIGQGVLTALAQIAAEELDVSPARLRIVSGETPTSPREGFTSGSNSIAISGSSIRLVCAEVRALFLRYVADRLACPIGALAIEDGRFLRAGRHIGQDYWSIAAEVDLARPAAGDAAPKPPSNYRIVGQSLSRLDLADKVTGAAFIHDLAPDDVLHARMLRRPWPGATLADFDEAAVRRAAGAPIDIVRDGDLVAFTSDDECGGDAGSAIRARTCGVDRRRPATLRRGRTELDPQPARARSHRGNGGGGGRRGKPRGRGELFTPVPRLWFDRAVMRAGGVQGRRADGLDPLPGCVRAAQMARACTAHRSRAGHGLAPAGRRLLRAQLGR